ncbi:MAG TPA: hypothetical protein VFI06_01290 [Chitinophagaceae bacterium]|nr:hypothetical protein [Chitinophagaceae bacterium]
MKRTLIFLVFIQTACLAAWAQQPEEGLKKLSTQNPIEKIYFHFDRNDYMVGQTIWFKAYLYSDFLPAGRSTDLFIELSGPSSVINRLALPVFAGFAHGQIELPDTLPAGAYVMRAYTATMLNHDPAFVYKKTFFFTGKKKKALSPAISPATRMEFFPEGGNFVTGLSNSIAFKATNENGLPVKVTGIIKDDKGETVTEFSSYHDGMGYFDLTAAEKNNYYAVLNNDPSAKKYQLPSQTTKGVVFRVITSGPTKTFEILQRDDDPSFRASYMIGQMQHHMVYKKVFKENDELTGIIPVDKLSSGILHLTVFNKDGLPLAERLTFVDNKEYVQEGDINVDTLNFSDRSKNHFTLSLKDTVQGSFSVSVYDPAFDLLPGRPENIFSSLLLTSDLKGYVHNPAYYFSATNDTVQNALDLVMMTNGWTRFKWADLPNDIVRAKKYSDPEYISLSGTINLESTKKPFADKDLLLFVVSANSGKNMQLLHTDGEGRFKLDSAVFFGNTWILFTDIKGRKSRFIDVKLNGDSLFRQYILPPVSLTDYSYKSNASPEREQRLMDEYNAFVKAEGLLLEGVTVKARKKTALEETEEKYVSGLFSGTANSTLDVTKENLTGYPNIFDYLKMRVPGLQILNDPEGPGYIVEFRQSATASSMGEIPMTIFLNEIPSDADALSTIPAYEIALVKVYSTFVGAWGNAPGGVLAVYTKKDADLSSLPKAGKTITYRGYSIVQEFYSPDYSVEKKTDKPDHRLTLYWNPSVIGNGINPKIPISFFNNDRTKQFRVVVEGVTIDGKLLMIEKTIGAKAF